jgi:hypothetical protein
MWRFRIAVIINSEYFPKETLTVDLDNGDTECSLRGRN